MVTLYFIVGFILCIAFIVGSKLLAKREQTRQEARIFNHDGFLNMLSDEAHIIVVDNGCVTEMIGIVMIFAWPVILGIMAILAFGYFVDRLLKLN